MMLSVAWTKRPCKRYWGQVLDPLIARALNCNREKLFGILLLNFREIS